MVAGRGTCAVAGGMRGCQGGMHGNGGGGHVWQRGVCVTKGGIMARGGMHGIR